MEKVRQLLCDHEFEPRSVDVDSGDLLQKCTRCGKRVRSDYRQRT